MSCIPRQESRGQRLVGSPSLLVTQGWAGVEASEGSCGQGERGLFLVHACARPPSLRPWQAAGEAQVSSSSSGVSLFLPWVLSPIPHPCSPGANQNIGLGPLMCSLLGVVAGADMEGSRNVGRPSPWGWGHGETRQSWVHIFPPPQLAVWLWMNHSVSPSCLSIYSSVD